MIRCYIKEADFFIRLKEVDCEPSMDMLHPVRHSRYNH